MNRTDEAQQLFLLADELRAQADAAERLGRLLLMEVWDDEPR